MKAYPPHYDVRHIARLKPNRAQSAACVILTRIFFETSASMAPRGFKTTTRYTMCINDTPLYKLELNNISEHHIHVKHFLVRVCLGQGPDTIPSTQIYTTVMYLLGAARSFLSVSNTYAHTNTHTLLSGGSAEGGLCGVQLSAWHQCSPPPPLPPPPRLLRSSRKLVT